MTLWIGCVARLSRSWVRASRILAAGRLPPQRQRSPSAGSVEERDAVAPLRLGPVHRLVGGDEDRLGAAGGLAAEHGDADADRRCAQLGVTGEALSDLRPQVLAQLQRPPCVGLRHQHRELVAGEAGDEVGLADALAQDRGDAADQGVAGLVAEPVVDLLEAVDVDDHRRPRPP